ncbi:MAG TPA: amidophosphoribosyltransferase [Gammaproteobacteria bacterium]|nr:ComF family protein [Arenicellales bacterium]HCX86391.1 amidophosphoribosyltransferase [Gammaproteobacteria bacterium]|tara:strand:+ start:45930 stop:46604 length:675 start_codon:yes stop_codon:yes gene_type:complete
MTPPCCLFCHDQPEYRHGLCHGCWHALPFSLGWCCSHCGRALAQAGICGQCQQSPPAFDEIAVPLVYGAPVDRMLCALKYRQHLSFARTAAGVIADTVLKRRQKRPDLLCAVPMTPRALRRRGLNQSAFIARLVSRRLGIPVRVSLLKKVRDTDQQSTLGARKRRKNLIGVFTCKRRLDGRHIALIDDILTTGATANEVSKILKAAGAARVDIWVCARTGKPSN